jgi:hypothetical protein
VAEFVVQREALEPLLQVERGGNRRVETLACHDALVDNDGGHGVRRVGWAAGATVDMR